MIDGAIAEHLEILRRPAGRRIGVRLVPRVRHAHAVHRTLLDAVDRLRLRNAGRFEDRRSDVDDVMELTADAADVIDVARPGDGHALGRAAEVRRHLLHPFERRVERPRPWRGEMRVGAFRSPERIPEKLVFDRHLDAVEGRELVRRAVEHALRARAVVAADVDDQGVVELAEVLDRLDDAADLVVCIRLVGAIDVRLPDEELLLLQAQRVPLRQLCAAILGLSVRPLRQLGVFGHDPEALLIGEDRLAQLVPAVVEQVHGADLLDPFRRRIVRRMGAAGHVIDKERLVRRDLLELLHVVDGLVGHGGREIPAGIALEGKDRGRVAIEVRLPLARVAADEAVEIVEAHSNRPLVERPSLGRLIGRRVVVFAEPRGPVTVLLQDRADGAVGFQNDRVVARKAGADFVHDAEARDVVIATRDQRRPRRRAQRGRVEVGVAQPGLRDAIQSRTGDDAAEGARHAEAVVVRHDEQDVRRALRRHDARRPPGRRLRRLSP